MYLRAGLQQGGYSFSSLSSCNLSSDSTCPLFGLPSASVRLVSSFSVLATSCLPSIECLFSLCVPRCLLFLLASPCCPRQSALSVLLFYCRLPRCRLVSSVPPDLRLFRYLLTYASLLAALTADAILRLALVLSSLPLFHYGLRCGVLTTLYIQRLSL